MPNLHTYLHPRVKGMQNRHLPHLLRFIPQFAQICIIFALSNFEANPFFRPVLSPPGAEQCSVLVSPPVNQDLSTRHDSPVKKSLSGFPSQDKNKFETPFRLFVESVGGSEQGSQHCFADVFILRST